MTILRMTVFLYVIELNINNMLIGKMILSNEFINIYFRYSNIFKYLYFFCKIKHMYFEDY